MAPAIIRIVTTPRHARAMYTGIPSPTCQRLSLTSECATSGRCRTEGSTPNRVWADRASLVELSGRGFEQIPSVSVDLMHTLSLRAAPRAMWRDS